jgi:hypothetical protein
MRTRDSSLCTEWHAGLVLSIRMSLPFIVILNELFGRGRIPTKWVWEVVMKILSSFKHDLSIENLGFFTAFRMTRLGWFVQWERGILHFVQNDMPGWFCRFEWVFLLLSFWTSFLGEEESLQRLRRFELWQCYRLLFMIRPLSEWDSSLRSEWHARLVLSFWTSFWARKNPYCECVGLSCENVIGYYLWFDRWEREILHFVQNDKQG